MVDLAAVSKALNTVAPAPADSKYPWPSPAASKVIEQLITLFCDADQERRDAATAALNNASKIVLQNYAWLKAEEAVRLGDGGNLIREGLLALAVENGPSDHPRHDVVVVAALFHRAEKLRLGYESYFWRSVDVCE